MKKLFFILIPLLLTSCFGVETARFEVGTTKFEIGTTRDFVVGEIEKDKDNTSVYTAELSSSRYLVEAWCGYPSFIAKTGLFQIGDTVRLYNSRTHTLVPKGTLPPDTTTTKTKSPCTQTKN